MSRFSPEATEIRRNAQALSVGYQSKELTNTLHFTLALARDVNGAAALKAVGVDPDAAIAFCLEQLGPLPENLVPASLVAKESLRKILAFAYGEAIHMGDTEVTPASMVLALVRENDCLPARWLNGQMNKHDVASAGEKIWEQQGKHLPRARNAILQMRRMAGSNV
jgi:ATP-dependent Clp protease ATP-binding subunit ClpA